MVGCRGVEVPDTCGCVVLIAVGVNDGALGVEVGLEMGL